MRISYYTSVRLDEYNAPAEHVRGFCEALVSTNNLHSLVRPTNSLVKQQHLEWMTVTDIPVWYPRIRGGWRVFEALVQRRLRSLPFHEYNIAYFRFTPSLKLARTLSDSIRGPLKVLELNGSTGINTQTFQRFGQAMDLILVDSPEMQHRLESLFPTTAPRVATHRHPATNTSIFRPQSLSDCRTELLLPQLSPVILHVSGFQRQHDFETIVDATASLVHEFPDIKLILLGDGPRREEVAKLAMAKLSPHHYLMPGSVPPHIVASYISAADVCINTFTRVALQDGNLRAYKLYEYMACERPVIEAIDATRQVDAWAQEILHLVPAESPSAVTSALREILLHPERTIRRVIAGRAYVNTFRTWDTAAKETLGLISRLYDHVV